MFVVFLGTLSGGKLQEISAPFYQTEHENVASELSDEVNTFLQYMMSKYNGKPVLCFYKEVKE